MPFEVPSSWEIVPLSELFMLNPKNDVEDNVEVGFIPMANVEDGFSGEHSFEVREWKDVKKGYCHFQNGDIGVAKISPCFENLKSCIFHSLPNGFGTGTTELVILRSMGVYSPFYLHLFKSTWYISQGTKYFKGVVGQQRVNKAIFTELEVPLPSYREQQRIVAEIEKWFALIDIIEIGKTDLQTTIKQTKSKILDLAIHGKLVPQDPNDEPASDLLKRINPKAEITCDNGQYGKISKGWCLCRLGDIGKIVTGNTPTKDIAEYYGGNIPFYKPADLEEGKCIKNASDHLSVLGFEQARKIPANSILVTCIGATIGKTGLITVEGSCNQQINAIIPNEVAYAEFIYYTCISDYMQKEIKSNASATTLPILNKGNFAKLPFPLPPYNEQQRIVNKIEELFTSLDNIQKALEV